MFISDIYSKDYPAFAEEQSIAEAAEQAMDFGFSHIFIEKNGAYLGAIHQNFLDENSQEPLKTLDIHMERFAILEDANLLDTFRLFHTFEANIIPVINREEQFLGYISYDDIFAEFSKYPLFNENGAVLTLQTKNEFYSMAEISTIVESNNAKIYACYVSKIEDEHIQITLKISNKNLISITETFERYGYLVMNKFYNDEREQMMKERFGFFQKYLEFWIWK